MAEAMSETVISVRISQPLLQHASQQASRSGMSLEDWLLVVAADRVQDEQVAERFFRHKLPQDQAARMMMEILDSGPDNPPRTRRRTPEGYISSRAVR